MPRNAGELDLNCHTFRGSNEFRTHRFVDDAAIARGERQRIADVFGGGGDIEQQPGFAWVCFLGEVQPKFAVPQCLRRVLENLALSDSRDAAPPVVNVALRNASAAQERCDWDVARDGRPWPSARRPRRAWQDCLARFRGHGRRSDCESLCDCAAELTAICKGPGTKARKIRKDALPRPHHWLSVC
jgi:hypothetical protein